MHVVRPALLPDELASGYEGRVMRYNGWRDAKDARVALRAWLGRGEASGRDTPVVELLAHVSGQSLPAFLRSHSLLPLLRAITSGPAAVAHGVRGQPSLLWTLGARLMRPGAYLCRQCVHEDFDFHGTSYWRREHQLPGLFWCSKHGCALTVCSKPDAFLGSPTEAADAGQAIDQRWVEALQQCPVVGRFLSICNDLMESVDSVDERDVSRTLKRRAADIGLHVGRGKVKAPLLSDRIKQALDGAWLDTVLPGLRAQPQGEYWHPVDAVLNGKRSCVNTTTYAIALAMLFEADDEASNALRSLDATQKPVARRTESPTVVADEDLRTQYERENGRHADVAHALGLNRRAATARLHGLGLPDLQRISASTVLDIANAVLTGACTLNDAATRVGADLEDVKTLFVQGLRPLMKTLTSLGAGTRGSVATRRRVAGMPPVAPPAPSQHPKGRATRPPRMRPKTPYL
jgi:hypothetical protein